MKKFLVILILLGGLAAGGYYYLATFDLPPPIKRIEKVIPDDRFEQ